MSIETAYPDYQATLEEMLAELENYTIGLAASIESLSRVVAPLMGGVLLQNLGTWAPGIFGAIVMAWVVSFVWRRLIVNPDPPLPDRSGGPMAYATVRVESA